MAAPHARVVKFCSYSSEAGPHSQFAALTVTCFERRCDKGKETANPLETLQDITHTAAGMRCFLFLYQFVTLRNLVLSVIMLPILKCRFALQTPSAPTHPSSTFSGMKQMRIRRRISNSINACVKQMKGNHCFGQFRHRCLWVQELSNQECFSFGFPCGLDMYMSVSDAPVKGSAGSPTRWS